MRGRYHWGDRNPGQDSGHVSFAAPAAELGEYAMSWDEDEDNTLYKVVLNHEEQYSIWPADRDNPPGWNDAGKSGPKQECLAYIEEVWTDMRPLSLRKQMEEDARRQDG